jgi:hypothetical protein
MTLPLFVYGTLRDPDLLAAVLGRKLRPAGQHVARAPGFRAIYYPGRIYPALIREPGAAAERLAPGPPDSPRNPSYARPACSA